MKWKPQKNTIKMKKKMKNMKTEWRKQNKNTNEKQTKVQMKKNK